MLSKLNNFTYKSFVEYTNPSDLHFRKKNILFGYNGKGKSSIAIGIKVEFLKDTAQKLENLRVFDRDYISNSLLIENSDDKIKGVEASFGEDSVEIEIKIKDLEKLIIKENEIEKIDSEISRVNKEIRSEIDKIHDRRKGNTSILRKSKDDSLERVIELYKNDFQEAKKIESDGKKLLEIIGDNSIEKKIDQIESLEELSVSKIQTTIIDEINEVFKEKFGEDISIPEFEVVQWIESGLKHHKEGDNCKFCDNKFDFSDVKKKITQYKENKRHQATEKLIQFRDKLKSFEQDIKAIDKESKTYSTIIGDGINQYFSAISEKKKAIDVLITSCQSKIDNIEVQESFDFELLTETIKETGESILTIAEIKNQQLLELITKQSYLTILVKGAIGLEILNSAYIKEKQKEFKIKEIDLKVIREKNEEIQRQIQELKQQKSLTKDFAVFVSQILNDINVSLRVELDTDNKNYIIKSTHENATCTIKDISEGEKNLLALLFFYYELFVDNAQENIKPEIKLIIVDDPISSMDDSNKFYILELMRNLLKLSKQQIFVLTHSWDDFCNLSYDINAWENDNDATFEIRKNQGKSELSKLICMDKPYKYLFKEIYNFSQKRDEEIGSECQIYHYPNVMRRIFEEWYSFKIGKHLNFTNKIKKRVESDFKITLPNEKTNLGLIIKVCNILSHSINGTLNPQEIHLAAKYLMNLIKKNDELHFNKMKE